MTVNSNGYGFFEKENEFVDLKVYPLDDDRESCIKHIEEIKKILDIEENIKLAEIKEDNWQ